MMQRGWAAIGKILVALLVLIIAAAAVMLSVAIRDGISARTKPTAVEELLSRSVRHLAIPVSARNRRNPVPLTAAVLKEGRDHFADHCSMCHANDGSGDTEMGPNLYPRVTDLRSPRTQNLSDGELFYIIRHGVRLTGMPAWGGVHDDEDNWKLVHFIRHLPKITPAELEEMKKLNPMTPQERDEQNFLEGH
jgi:mono/diheme cytochrome c family protein